MNDIELIWYEYIEKLFNERNLELIEVLFSPQYILNGEPYDHAQIRTNLQSFFSAFPDCYLTIDKQFSRGVCIISNWTLHGTHLGEYQGKAPTGKQVLLHGTSEVCIYRGKIIKQWREMNQQTLEQQLESDGGDVK